MLSLIEVKCPHCGAQGQIMLPPLGAIIVGPCPECQGMVVVFCGRVMPLDKDIMQSGSTDEKQDHLVDVLGQFLQERVKRLFANQVAEPDADAQDDLGEHDEESLQPEPGAVGLTPGVIADMISDEEFDMFVNTDLKLIDNPKYFKAVFE